MFIIALVGSGSFSTLTQWFRFDSGDLAAKVGYFDIGGLPKTVKRSQITFSYQGVCMKKDRGRTLGTVPEARILPHRKNGQAQIFYIRQMGY
jgi:hypothetical protein